MVRQLKLFRQAIQRGRRNVGMSQAVPKTALKAVQFADTLAEIEIGLYVRFLEESNNERPGILVVVLFVLTPHSLQVAHSAER
jgi:hypothetical protein